MRGFSRSNTKGVLKLTFIAGFGRRSDQLDLYAFGNSVLKVKKICKSFSLRFPAAHRALAFFCCGHWLLSH